MLGLTGCSIYWLRMFELTLYEYPTFLTLKVSTSTTHQKVVTLNIMNMFGRESDPNLVDLFSRLLQTILALNSIHSLVEPTCQYNQYVEAFGLSFLDT